MERSSRQVARLLQPPTAHHKIPQAQRMESTLAMSKAFVEGLIAEHTKRSAKGLHYEVVRNWYHDECLHMYVRVGSAWQDRNVVGVLDLASIQVAEAYRRRGLFKALLVQMQRQAQFHERVLRVENVLNPDLLRWFRRQPGWIESEQLPGNFRFPLRKRI